jgi:hypothetical protein
MSGFEVAGIVLAVIPIAISALEHYRTGVGDKLSYKKWRGHLEKLIFRLKVQRTIFYLHSMELLREAKVPGLADAVDLQEDDCVKLLQDVKTGKAVKAYLGHLYERFEEIVQDYESCLRVIISKLGHIRRLPEVRSGAQMGVILGSCT